MSSVLDGPAAHVMDMNPRRSPRKAALYAAMPYTGVTSKGMLILRGAALPTGGAKIASYYSSVNRNVPGASARARRSPACSFGQATGSRTTVWPRRSGWATRPCLISRGDRC